MPLSVGTLAPPITGTDLVNNQAWALQDHAGKVVLLAFSGITWCGPCQLEAPALENVWEQLAGPGFTMAIISGHFGVDEPEQALKNAIAQYGITFPVVPGDSFWPAYQINGVPTLYCLHWNDSNNQHEVAAVLSGASGTTEEITAHLLEFLAGCGVNPPPKPAPDFSRWTAVWLMLFGGVLSDGGGLGVTPGGKPVPIGPWDPLRFVGPLGRDALGCLAVAELAGQLHDPELRSRLWHAGIAGAASSLRRLEKLDRDEQLTSRGPVWGPERRSTSAAKK
jgi:peroxiredoxin